MRIIRIIFAGAFLEMAVLFAWLVSQPSSGNEIAIFIAAALVNIIIAIVIAFSLRLSSDTKGVKIPLLLFLGILTIAFAVWLIVFFSFSPFFSLFFILPLALSIWSFVKALRDRFKSESIRKFTLTFAFLMFAILLLASSYAGFANFQTCSSQTSFFHSSICDSLATPMFWIPVIPIGGFIPALGVSLLYILLLLVGLLVIPLLDIVDSFKQPSSAQISNEEPTISHFSKAEKIFGALLIGILIIGDAFLYAQARIAAVENNPPPCVYVQGGIPCAPIDVPDKPVIYLYPTHEEKVSVTLNYAGTLTTVYPSFDSGTTWNVTAYPNGELIHQNDNKQYSYLFWEGEDNHQYDISRGFVVKGSDTASFLQNQLAAMGLTPKEYNEMIVYWLPKMENNPYNLIHFAGSDYTTVAKLTITPTPDSLLRVFMVWKPLQTSEQMQPQIFPTFTRNGFTVVEWGGTEVQ